MELKDPGVIKFKTKLIKDKAGNGTFFYFPFNVQELFGTKGNVKVEIKVDDFEWRGLLTNMGGAHHFIGLRKEIRDTIKKDAGDEVDVSIKLDTQPRIVEVPKIIQDVLDKHPQEAEYFNKLSFTHKKEYVDWISSAKKEETRNTRLEKMIEMLKKI